MWSRVRCPFLVVERADEAGRTRPEGCPRAPLQPSSAQARRLPQARTPRRTVTPLCRCVLARSRCLWRAPEDGVQDSGSSSAAAEPGTPRGDPEDGLGASGRVTATLHKLGGSDGGMPVTLDPDASIGQLLARTKPLLQEEERQLYQKRGVIVLCGDSRRRGGSTIVTPSSCFVPACKRESRQALAYISPCIFACTSRRYREASNQRRPCQGRNGGGYALTP